MENSKTNSESGPLSTIQTDFIVSWDTLRKEREEVQEIFISRGNRFNLVLSNKRPTSFHIYLARDESNGLHFYFISSKDDADRNFEWIYASPLEQQKYSLPTPIHPLEGHPLLDWEKANSWVNNWIDDTKRNDWIASHFSSEIKNNNIVQAFVINATDFEINDVHHCFLALRDDGNGGYQADLVVYNTVTHHILNFKEKDSSNNAYHDLARPVPPFGQGATTSQNFGVLVSLGIQ